MRFITFFYSNAHFKCFDSFRPPCFCKSLVTSIAFDQQPNQRLQQLVNVVYNANSLLKYKFLSSWEPSYVTIDRKILTQNILGMCWTNHQDRMTRWRTAVNLQIRIFSSQDDRTIDFHETIQTDVVGVIVIKKNPR